MGFKLWRKIKILFYNFTLYSLNIFRTIFKKYSCLSKWYNGNEVFGNSSNGSVYLHFCHRKDLLGMAEFLHGIPLYAVSL